MTITMTYKAVLCGVPGLERPIECYGQSPENLRAWAVVILRKYPVEKYPDRSVKLYRTVEELVDTIIDAEHKTVVA